MSEVYLKYNKGGRNFLNLATLLIGGLFIGLLCYFPPENEILFLFAIAVTIFLVVYGAFQIIRNPIKGLIISSEEIIIDPKGKAHRIPISSVDHFEVRSGMDWTEYYLHLKTGKTINLALRIPDKKTTAKAFSLAGIVCKGVESA